MSADGPATDGRGTVASSSSSAGFNRTETRTPSSKPSQSNRRKSHKQLSAKQLDKIVKNLTSVQKSVGHLRSDSIGSLSHIGEMSNYENAINDENILLGEDGQRELASFAIEGEEGILLGETTLTGLDLNQVNGAELYLQRKGLDKSLFKGFSKGPDGIALAKVAAKGPKGKDSAPPDSFLHESTFVFNPLNRRIPHQTPRKQASSGLGMKESEKLPKESFADRIARTKPVFKNKDTNEKVNNVSVEQQSVGDATFLESLASVPKEIQEALVLEDLLFLLSGIEGQYFHYAPHYSPEDLGSRLRGAQFIIDPGLDQSLQDVVGRILPLATHYTAIFAFVEAESSLEFGTVIHALCAAIRNLLKEYEILIIQLEHQMATSPAFTLQKLWFYVHPTLRTMSLLHNFINEIIEVSHANVLDAEEEAEADSSDDEDDDDDDEEDSLDRKRRQLLNLDDEDEDRIVGGIVKGGEVLSLLYDRVIKMGGDEAAHKLFRTLLLRSAQPYAEILVRWITTGDLSDTYEEFLVMENPKVTQASLESDPTDEFWERRYTLRDETAIEQKEHERQQGLDLDEMLDQSSARGILTGGAKIPAFLEPWKRKILLAGKYLNVIRECGKDVSAIPEIAEHSEVLQSAEEIDMTDESFFAGIETAYQRANTALLSLLLDEHNIVIRLRSMKHYFFQTHSDFFSSFLEAAGRELRKEVVPDKVRDVTIMRLQSHLGMVLGSSNCVGYTDPFREDVKVTLASENAYDQLKRIAEIKGGIEAARAQAKLAKQKDRERVPLMELLQFDLTVKFPVSLVISKKNILRWQFLQRPLINLKATEKALCDVFTEHQEPAWRKMEKGHPELQKWKMRIFHLRHRILFFVQQVMAFMTAEVIEPNWRDLEIKMERATTVDQFLKDHFDFLNLCRKECMLTDLRYVEMMSKLMSVAMIFCDNRVRFRDQLHMERANWQKDLLESSHQMKAPLVSEDVLAFLKKMEGHWEKRLNTFKDIVALLSTTDNPSALPLSYRLQSA